MILTIGAIPIYSSKIENYKEHQALLEPYVNDSNYWHRTKRWMSQTQSTMGHPKNTDLPWDVILKDIEPHLHEYLQIFGPRRKYGIQTRPWLNKYEKGGWQEQHNHTGPAAHFSMAYTINSQSQQNFIFVDSVGNWYDSLWELPDLFTNWPHRTFTPDQSDGTLLIFPSALDHYVLPNLSNNYRVSASANFYIQEEQ